MSVVLNFLLLAVALLAPFTLAATFASRARRDGYLRWNADQFRFAAPLAGPLFDDDADRRRVDHDVDAIRTRFERQPSWPSAGAQGERR